LLFDKRTGKAAKFTREQARLKVATWPYREDAVGLWDLRVNQAFTSATYGGQPRYFDFDIGESENAWGSRFGRRFTSRCFMTTSCCAGCKHGRENRRDCISKPVGLHALPTIRSSPSAAPGFVKVNAGDGKVTPFITKSLVAPHSVTTDKREISTSATGAPPSKSRFFAQGQTPACGRKARRPAVAGRVGQGWHAGAARGAVTDDGKLWVAEDDTRPNGSASGMPEWRFSAGLYRATPYGGGASSGSIPGIPPSVTRSAPVQKSTMPERRTRRRRWSFADASRPAFRAEWPWLHVSRDEDFLPRRQGIPVPTDTTWSWRCGDCEIYTPVAAAAD